MTVDRDELWRLHEQGLGAKEIAEQLGCTHRSAQQMLYVERKRRAGDCPKEHEKRPASAMRGGPKGVG